MLARAPLNRSAHAALTGIVLAQALIWPAGWAAFTLVRGGITGWYPYPFLDVGELGAAHTAVNVLGIALFFGAVATVVLLLDHRRGRTAPPVAD